MSEEGLLSAHSQVAGAVLQAVMKIAEARVRRREEIARRDAMLQRDYANALRAKEAADRSAMQSITRAALQPGFVERSRPEDIARLYVMARAWSEVDVQARFVADSLEPLVTQTAAKRALDDQAHDESRGESTKAPVVSGLEGDEHLLSTLSEEESIDYARRAELSGEESARAWLRSEFVDRVAGPEHHEVPPVQMRPLSEAPREDLYGRAWVATLRENPKMDVDVDEVERAVQDGSASPAVMAAFETSRQALLDSGGYVDVDQNLAILREAGWGSAAPRDVALDVQWMIDVLDREEFGRSGPTLDTEDAIAAMREVLTAHADDGLYVDEWKAAVSDSAPLVTWQDFRAQAAREDTRGEADKTAAVEAFRATLPDRLEAALPQLAPIVAARRAAEEERTTREPELAARPQLTLAAVYADVTAGTASERVIAAALGADAVTQFDRERRERAEVQAQERIDAADLVLTRLRAEAADAAEARKAAEREHGVDSGPAFEAREREDQTLAFVQRQEEERDRLIAHRDGAPRADAERTDSVNVSGAAAEQERILEGKTASREAEASRVHSGPPSPAKVAASEAAPGFPGTIAQKLQTGRSTRQGKPSQRVLAAGQGRGRELQR